MITIELTHDKDLVKEILTTPKLWREISDDVGYKLLDSFEPNPYWTYLIARKDDEVVGLIELHSVNSVTVEAHINMLPEYWGVRMDEVAKEAIKWIKEQTKIRKVISKIPADCKQVLEAIKRYGFSMEGFSPKSIERKGQIVGTYLFGLEIR